MTNSQSASKQTKYILSIQRVLQADKVPQKQTKCITSRQNASQADKVQYK